MKNIFSELQYLLEEKEDAVLVTVIRDEGSTPRGAGSQMLVTKKGLVCGTVGGGAVEKRSIDVAKKLIGTGKSMEQDFELIKNADEGIGMECGGNVSVYFQYVDASDKRWERLTEAVCGKITSGEGGWFIQSLDGSFPMLADADGSPVYGNATVIREDFTSVRCILVGKHFIMPLPVGERAIIFGAGHCALALAPLLNSVGFRVTVMDDRDNMVTKERYPMAEQLICGDFTKISDYIEISPDDYIVVMTSGHKHDYEVEEQVLRTATSYVGVIGSRNKTASVNAMLKKAGITDDVLAGVHTPVGLPIKAETPEEIAVSIAAEMILVRAENREKS